MDHYNLDWFRLHRKKLNCIALISYLLLLNEAQVNVE